MHWIHRRGKAFDSTEHEAIFKAFRKLGINEIYTTKISTQEPLPEYKWIIPRGMRQGDQISPKLFTATIREVFKHAQLRQKGININGEKLAGLQCRQTDKLGYVDF